MARKQKMQFSWQSVYKEKDSLVTTFLRMTYNYSCHSELVEESLNINQLLALQSEI